MRIVEILNGIKLPITNEEADLLDKYDKFGVLLKASLNEREQVIANQLVNKSVFYRRHQDGRIEYRRQASG